jgi:hypothetical protein
MSASVRSFEGPVNVAQRRVQQIVLLHGGVDTAEAGRVTKEQGDRSHVLESARPPHPHPPIAGYRAAVGEFEAARSRVCFCAGRLAGPPSVPIALQPEVTLRSAGGPPSPSPGQMRDDA